MVENVDKPPPKKRGRKSKKTLEEEKRLGINQKKVEKIPKKRGRKPKGGKVIKKAEIVINQTINKRNIILHLKCRSDDIKNDYFISNNEYTPNIENIESYSMNGASKTAELSFELLPSNKNTVTEKKIEMIESFKKRYNVTLETVEAATENVTFKIPKILRETA